MAVGRIRPPRTTAVQPAARNNLRAPRELIGRDEDGSAVHRLVVEAPGRLVTLTGTAGVGKTELALLVANAHAETFTSGIWFVDFASVQIAELLPSAIADVLLLGRPVARRSSTRCWTICARANCCLCSTTVNT
jgi:hypothetical protein